MKIHIWAPNIFGFTGGIQAFSGFLVKAFQGIHPDSPRCVALKHDRYSEVPDAELHTRYICAGAAPGPLRTIYFSLLLVWHALIDRPQLIVTTHLNFSPVAVLIKTFLRIPFWAVAHGVDAWDIRSPLLKYSLRSCDLILAVSEFTQDKLISDLSLPGEQLVVFPNTYNETRFEGAHGGSDVRKELGLSDDAQVLLTVARLDEETQAKGYDRVIDALPQVLEVFPETHYVIVGKGADRDRLVDHLEQSGLSDSVTLAGFVSDEELPKYYDMCDLFIMPGTGEGFGIVFIEAMACGKPVLAGNADGSVEALANGELGVLVDPDDTKELGDSIVKILERSLDHELMFDPAALREAVRERFGFESFQARLHQLLERAEEQ